MTVEGLSAAGCDTQDLAAGTSSRVLLCVDELCRRIWKAMKPYAARPLSPAPLRRNSKSSSSALPMLTPLHAWRMLCRRTGGNVSLTTFYRWINSGRIGVVRVGSRYLIPLPLLEEVIEKCLDGERI